MKIYPVNPAEAVIAPFFDIALSPEDEWTIIPGEGAVNVRKGRGYSTMIFWDKCVPDKIIFTWEWKGKLDLTGYDGLFLQCAFPDSVLMIFGAKIDGKWQVITESYGCNMNEDYEGVFSGNNLEEIKLTFVSRKDAAGGFGTYYLGVFNKRRLNDWLSFENTNTYDKNWDGFIKPEAEWGELKPQLGLHFDYADLGAIRKKLMREPYKSLVDVMRKEAYSFLSRKPEKEIRTYMRVGVTPMGYSSRSRDRGLSLWRPMEQCAFFGLLDNDPELVRISARCVISLAHVKHWAEGFVEHDFPGSAVNWRSFFQGSAVISMVCAFDWMGSVLTDHAKEVISHGLYFKGLTPIKYDFARYSYIYEMNQAAIFSLGRIYALLMLNKLWPRVGWELEQAERDLHENVGKIIHGDGGYGEGPAYYSAVMYYVVCSYLLLAKHKNIPVQEMITEGIRNSADYFGLFVSTAGKAERLAISDGVGTHLSLDWIAMTAYVTADARWNKLLNESIENMVGNPDNLNKEPARVVSSARTLIYGPEDLTRRTDIIPVFRIHNSSGHATSLRNTERGSVRIHLCGSSVTEEHSHEDKSAIILEVFSEQILIDRGIQVYNDPSCYYMKDTRMHNTLSLIDEKNELGQINPCPKPVCPSGDGDDKRLNLKIDITPAWKEFVSKMTRSIDSDNPYEFTVTDEVELTKPMRVVFNLYSRFPLKTESRKAVFKAERSELRVEWDWEGEILVDGEELFDGERVPVNHLAVCSLENKNHKLVTRFKII